MTFDNDADARPTLKTIAQLTGLSVASVSRALKNAPDIGEETKSRVRATAEKVGYRPNRAGVRLRTGRTNVIALVMGTENDLMNHTSRLIYSVAATLRNTPFHMVVMPYFPDEDPMNPIRYIWETGSADGVIINQTGPDDPRVRFMRERRLAFATHGRTHTEIEHPYFDFDNEAFARLMVRALAARGRRNLMLITPPVRQSYGQHMSRGFLDEAAALGLTARLAPGITSDDVGGVIDQSMAAVLAADDRPDGIIVGSTHAAISAVGSAERRGLTIGRDYDLASKEAIPILKQFRPEMIVVREDVGRAGRSLAEAVMAAIRAPDAAPIQGLEQPEIWQG